MRDDLRPGNKFPDIELPNHDKEVVKLSSLMRGFPTVVVFSRGYYCPKDRRQLASYVEHLQPELSVNYCKLVVVSVDSPMLSKEIRDGLATTFPFLSDEEKKVINELDIVDSSVSFTARWRFPTPSCLVVIARSTRFTTAGGSSVARQSKRCGWTIAP